MSLQDTINEALLKLVRQNADSNAVEVTSYYDTTEWSGGCETCGWDMAVVDIYYKTRDGKQKTYRYSGGFGDLIYELDRLSD